MSISSISASSSGNLPGAVPSETKVIGKDAEDILCKGLGRRLVRQTSAHQLGRGGEVFNPASKSSALWECTGRRPNQLGGYIDIFRIRPEFNEMEYADAITRDKQTGVYSMRDEARGQLFYARREAASEENGKQFPALDPFAWDLRQKQLASRQSQDDFWKKLGICCRQQEDGFYVEIPDHAALLANWDEFRKSRPEPLSREAALLEGQHGRQYPQQFSVPLDVISSDGIASDNDYFFSLLVRQGLYSNGPEAMHDFFTHLLPLFESIIMMEGYGKVIKCEYPYNPIADTSSYLESKKFDFSKFQYAKVMLMFYRKIMIVERLIQDGGLSISKERILQFKSNLDRIKANLGALADNTYTAKMMTFGCDEKTNKTFFTMLSIQMWRSFDGSWDQEDWQNYWQTKRPELGTFDFDLLRSLWKEIEAITAKFDRKRVKWRPAESSPAGPSSSSS